MIPTDGGDKMNEISKRIASVIDAKYNGNKSAFAREIKITPAYAAQLYSGQRIPSERTIVDIARVCGVKQTWLRSGEGEMFQAMTEDEELAAYIGDVMNDEPASFRHCFTMEMKNWTPEVWQMIEEICKLLETEKPDTE